MERRKIEKLDFSMIEQESEYYNCSFENCDFSKVRIDNVHFEECEFKCCNFSLTKFCASLRDVRFVECKMTGSDFSEIGKLAFSLTFMKSNLSYASFIEVSLKNTVFIECDLSEAYFDNANMSSSVFDKCSLTRTSFSYTNLEKADFSTSHNFCIDSNSCKLKKAVFSQTDLSGLLSHLDITIV